MKSKLIMFGLSAALAAPTMADVTITVTGATAFREAALLAIRDLYSPGVRYAHDGVTGQFQLSSEATFIGSVSGIAGTTTIRTAFNGSVEGLNAITNLNLSAQPLYIPAASVPAGTGETGVGINGTEQAFSDFSFSDVSIASSPYSAVSTYPSADSPVGVVVFTMLTNDGSPVTNVTSQNFRALLKAGYLQAPIFTGDTAHTGYVIAAGRNDGSGTRTTYLAESGYGITELVNQYTVTGSSGDENTVWTITGPANQPSTVWNQNVLGNGGNSSGSTLRGYFARKGTSANVVIGGTNVLTGQQVDAVTFVSLSDAVSARGKLPAADTGAKLIAYNGVKLDGVATYGTDNMTADDLEKVTDGAYTAWGNQQFYGANNASNDVSLNADKVEFFTQITAPTGIEANLGTAGVPSGDMNVFRSVDGGVVAP